MFKNTHKCYCAFCKHERRIYVKKHITTINVFLSLLSALLLMVVLWQGLDARVVLLFVLSISVAEVFIMIRWRLTLPCPYCGFDPILYKHSPKKCAEKVKLYLDVQKKRPSFYLQTKNPFLHLHPMEKKNDVKAKLSALPKKSAIVMKSGDKNKLKATVGGASLN